MKVALVTGGSGFLGSNLCARLIADGNRVICVDNNFAGRLENISPLLKNQNFKFIAHDVIEPLPIGEKIPIKVVRIFNTYGPNMATGDGRVVSNFICQALKQENITIYGNGTQTRSFCYVDDLIGITVKVMSRRDFTGPVNIGNPHEFAINELAQKILIKFQRDRKLFIAHCQRMIPSTETPISHWHGWNSDGNQKPHWMKAWIGR